MEERTPGRRGSGAQIFNRLLTELGLRLTAPQDLPQATERMQAAMLLHGSTAYETVASVKRLAWGSERDEDGEVVRQGVALAQSGLFVTDLLQDLLDAPGLKAHLQARHPEIDDDDYDAFASALWWLVCARDMYTHRLEQEQRAEPIDLDAWVNVVARRYLQTPREEEVVRDLDATSLALLDCLSGQTATLAQLVSGAASGLPCEGEAVLHLIEHLQARGLLFLHAGATPIDPAHLANVPDPAKTWVALTGTGALTWEAHYQPDWHQRVSHEVRTCAPGLERHELCAAARERLEAIRQQLPAHATQISLQTVTPLEMTYWKTFPQGYVLSFTLPQSERMAATAITSNS